MAAQSIYEQQVYPVRRQSWLDRVMHKAGEITLEYWAHAITVFLGIIVLAALSVPVLTYLGLDSLAKPLFFTLHLICAQIPAHSFYILGHQLGMCARNMGIYGSMFAGGLIFVLSKKRLPGIPWWVWVLMILPMAYDGLTQMFGLRESTWELRVLTGVLFGIGNMWFALPFIQRTIKEMMVTPMPVGMATPALTTQQFTPLQMQTPAIQQFAPLQTSTLISQPDLETPLPPPNTLIPTDQREDQGTILSEDSAPTLSSD